MESEWSCRGDRVPTWTRCHAMSRQLPDNLLIGYRMQWALNHPLRLVSSTNQNRVVLVNAYKLATQSRTFRCLLKDLEHRRGRNYSKETPQTLLVDCSNGRDVNDLAFAIHYCHLGQCRVTAPSLLERTLCDKPDDDGDILVVLSSSQMRLTSTLAECSLVCGLRVANTYGIDSLHETCLDFLRDNLSVQTCWEMWKTIYFFAPTLRAVDDKAARLIVDFIHENFRHFPPEELAHFRAEELELILASRRLNVHSELEVVEAIEAWIRSQSNEGESVTKITSQLIEHCVRLDQLEVHEIDRLLKLAGLQKKRRSPSSLVDNRCVWTLKQLRRRLLRATRNLRVMTPRKRTRNSSQSDLEWPPLPPRIPHEAIVIFGGWENGQPCRNVHILDSRRKLWVTLDGDSGRGIVLPHALMSFGVVNVANEFIYIAGGEIRSGQATQEVIRYDLTSCGGCEWRACAAMHEKRRDFVLLNYKNTTLYAIGGDNNRMVLDSVECLNLEVRRGGWREVASMIIPRGAPAGDIVGDLIYICGGYTESRMESLTNSCETYNPVTNQWSLIQPMAQPRYYASGVAYGNHLYILGGGGDNTTQRISSSVVALGYSSTVERFTPEEGVWELMPAIAERADFAACIHQGEIYCVGGGGEAFCTADVEAWKPWIGRRDRGVNETSRSSSPAWLPDEAIGGWRKETQLPSPLWGHRCVCVSGVERVTTLLMPTGEGVERDPAVPVSPQRWRVKKSQAGTVLVINDTD